MIVEHFIETLINILHREDWVPYAKTRDFKVLIDQAIYIDKEYFHKEMAFRPIGGKKQTLLSLLVSDGKEDMVEYLLQAAQRNQICIANQRASDQEPYSILQLAIALHRVKIVQLLCDHGANVNQSSYEGSPWLWAYHNGNGDIKAILQTKGAVQQDCDRRYLQKKQTIPEEEVYPVRLNRSRYSRSRLPG